MDAKVKERWLEDLRSGQYGQTRMSLRADSNSYCCLGILCNIVHPNDWTRRTTGCQHRGYEHRGAVGVPVSGVLEAAGISQEIAEGLADMNDSGKTFLEIADYIERRL